MVDNRVINIYNLLMVSWRGNRDKFIQVIKNRYPEIKEDLLCLFDKDHES